MSNYVTKSFTYEGKRYFVRGKTEKEALRKLIEKQNALANDEVLNPSLRTVRSWALEAVETYKVKQGETTRKVYLEKLDLYVLRKIGDKRLSKVTPIMCQQVVNYYAGKSKATINDVHQMLRFIFKTAIANGMINKDPTEFLIKPEGTYKPRRSLTTHEEKVFLQVLPEHYAGLYYALMYYCGCRPSEAASVEGRDIQRRDGRLFLHIRGTKTDNADRYVPIVPELEKMLPGKLQPFGLLCPNQRGNKMNKGNNLRAWKHLERLMNIAMGCRVYRNQLIAPFPLADDLSAYCLRHTFCTNLQKQGVDIRTAQYLMGHADIQMTANIYTHVDFEIIEEAAAKMSASAGSLNSSDSSSEVLDGHLIALG